jgi:diguanylate cyclase (GGDEF)-like protein
MTVPAQILFVSDRADASSVAGDLRDRGYNLIAARNADNACEALTEAVTDVIVVSLDDDEKAVSIARVLQARSGNRDIPAVVVAEDDHQACRNVGRLEIVTRPIQTAELHNRLTSLSRLTTMHNELNRRAETTKAYGFEGPEAVSPPKEIRDARIMLIGPDGPYLEAVKQAVGDKAQLTLRPTPFLARESLLCEKFDAVIAVADGNIPILLDFCRDSRSNSRLFNMPIILIADLEDFDRPSDPYDAFASEVVAPDTSGRQIGDRVMHLVKLSRYREALQEVYRSARHFATSDALTGLFSHGYLHAHLDKMIAAAQSSGKSLSLGFFDVANMDAVNEAYGYVTGDRILRQIGGMVGGLVRSEDLPARYGGHEFCVVLPDTSAEEAEPVIRRIAGVINFTEFADPSTEQPINVHMRASLTELFPDDCGKSLTTRGRKGLSDDEEPTATV